MKYWLLTTEYPPLHGGGISTYCYFTAYMLHEAGHDVTVFINDDSNVDFSIVHQPGMPRCIYFNSNREKLQHCLGYHARLSYAFAGIVKQIIEAEGKPDIIESQDYLGIAYYLTQFKHAGYSFLAGVRIALTIHSPAFIYLLYNHVPVYRFPDFWTGEMEKQSIAAADALIAPTAFILEEVARHMSLQGKPTAVIANPYKADTLPATGFTRNKIVYYGKLSPQKGSFELLEYFSQLWNNDFPHALHIIGGTDIVFHPEMKTMGEIARTKYARYIEKGLLQLHGKITPAQIQNSLADAHIIIVPSIVDNMPYVVMEAMSNGKIVLASEQGGQREMIQNGFSGFLFSHQDPLSFGRQLQTILSLTDVEVLQIGVHAREKVVNDYNFTRIWQQKQRFLAEVKSIPDNHFPFLYQEPVAPINNEPATAGILSVVIPFYNMGKYLEECLQSVTNSTYTNIEILVVNDGSTDTASLEKLRQCAAGYNIKVLHKVNEGLATTRNYGANAASGEFMAFLDADDKVAASYFEKAIRALQKNDNVYFAGAWVQYFENSEKVWPSFTPQPPYLLVHNMVNSSSLVYKRSAFLKGGLNDKALLYGLEDYESVIHMLAMGLNGIILPEVLFYYRVRTGSMFRNISAEKFLFSNKYIAEKHTHLYNRYSVPVTQLLNANGPGYLYDNPTFATKITVGTGPNPYHIEKLKTIIKKSEFLKKLALKLLKLKNKL